MDRRLWHAEVRDILHYRANAWHWPDWSLAFYRNKQDRSRSDKQILGQAELVGTAGSVVSQVMKINKKTERVVSINSNISIFIFRKDISTPSYAPEGLITNCISRAKHKWVNRPGWRSYTVLTTQPAKLAWMAASELKADTAIRSELGRRATEWIADRFKLSGPGVWPPSLNRSTIYSVAQHPSLDQMAVSAFDSDAAIRASFAGSARLFVCRPNKTQPTNKAGLLATRISLVTSR
jgi:hypothetical protein